MGFFKTLFTGKEETPEEKKENKNKRDFDILKYDGIQALKIGKHDYAIACLERALNIENDTEARTYLATAYTQTDQLDNALEQYELLSESHPDNPAIPISMAELHFIKEDYPSMESCCNKALSINPQLSTPHLLLAKCANAQADKINAIAECTKAIAAKEDNFSAYLFRAQVLNSIMLYGEAEKDIDFLLENSEYNEDILILKAKVSASLNKNDEATKYYKMVIDTNPFIPQSYIGLSTIYANEGNNDEAIKILDDGIEQNEGVSELYNTRGRIHYLSGNKEKAAADLKQALELAPEEGKNLNGEFTNLKDAMLEAYNKMNPYQFSIKI